MPKYNFKLKKIQYSKFVQPISLLSKKMGLTTAGLYLKIHNKPQLKKNLEYFINDLDKSLKSYINKFDNLINEHVEKTFNTFVSTFEKDLKKIKFKNIKNK